jgi:hypothetical protein
MKPILRKFHEEIPGHQTREILQVLVYSFSQVEGEHVGRTKIGKSALDVPAMAEIGID